VFIPNFAGVTTGFGKVQDIIYYFRCLKDLVWEKVMVESSTLLQSLIYIFCSNTGLGIS